MSVGMAVSVFPTRPEEIPQVVAMEQEALPWVCPFSATRHEALIVNPSAFHGMARDEEGQPIGFLILEGLGHPDGSVMLRRIVVRRPGHGLGTQLMHWAMQFVFERWQAHRLWLEVFTDNTAAIALYEKMGMQREGELRECIRQGDRWRSLYYYSILDLEYRQKYRS